MERLGWNSQATQVTQLIIRCCFQLAMVLLHHKTTSRFWDFMEYNILKKSKPFKISHQSHGSWQWGRDSGESSRGKVGTNPVGIGRFFVKCRQKGLLGKKRRYSRLLYCCFFSYQVLEHVFFSCGSIWAVWTWTRPFCVGLVWMIIAMHRRGLESAFLGTRSAEAMWRGNRRAEWFKSAGRDSTFISYTCMLVYTCIFLYYMWMYSDVYKCCAVCFLPVSIWENDGWCKTLWCCKRCSKWYSRIHVEFLATRTWRV